MYTKYIKELNKQVTIYGKACPLFVPLVEEGLWQDPVTDEIARRYLTELIDIDIDTLCGTLKESELGIYELGDLKYNGYFLFESSAPDGFTKDDRYFYFQIKTNGETVVIENELGVGFTNEPIPIPDDSPKTGDPVETFFWIVLASGALIVISVAAYVKRRNCKYRR